MILQGHVLDKINEIPDDSVQCVVTSPPFYGLRSYKTEPQIWSGDPNCQHEWHNSFTNKVEYIQGNPEFARPHRQNKSFSSCSATCSLCGAWRGELGSEPTIDLYIAHLVEVFREVRRVLRPDGTVFLNIDDSWAGGKGQSGQAWSGSHPDRETFQREADHITLKGETRPTDDSAALREMNLKPKDLCLIPERLKLALQADGWWIRSKIIWAKGVSCLPQYAGSVMPESVTLTKRSSSAPRARDTSTTSRPSVKRLKIGDRLIDQI